MAMLKSLRIKDFAIIEDLEAGFGPNLNVITGETGAGKTIIIEALKLVLGGRFTSDIIRKGGDAASVTAVFSMSDVPKPVAVMMDEMGIEADDELIVHRVVGAAKGRITINGVNVTAGALKEIAGRFVEISSQHEHQLLLDERQHAAILDGFGALAGGLAEYQDAHRDFVAAEKRLKDLRENERQLKEKLEFLKFQLGEIKGANLRPGEEKAVEEERSRLKYASSLEEKTRLAEGVLYRDQGSAVEAIDAAIKLVSECERLDASTGRWLEGLKRARADVEDASRGLAKYAEGLESNPERLDELEERLHLVRRLAKKYGGSVESCISRGDEIAAEINTVENIDDAIADYENQVASLRKVRRTKAEALHRRRAKTALELSKDVEAELAGLSMGRTQFTARIEMKGDEAAWDETGPDDVGFMIAPNIGEPLMPLVRIASGGELSRVMLAIKGALSHHNAVSSTSIFDEVDSGIGGAVADAVGKKLRDVAKARQVICITHLPQVAVYGDWHIRVSKRVKSGRTFALIDLLESDERKEEVARMLGGSKVTAATIAHAGEMLKLAKGF
jgi:DNA repair protein RecN (Recombination protein N)